MCVWWGGASGGGFLVNRLAYTKDYQITNNHSCHNYFKGAEVSASTAPVTAPRPRLCRAAQARAVHPRNNHRPRPHWGPGSFFCARLVPARRCATAGLVAVHVMRSGPTGERRAVWLGLHDCRERSPRATANTGTEEPNTTRARHWHTSSHSARGVGFLCKPCCQLWPVGRRLRRHARGTPSRKKPTHRLWRQLELATESTPHT